MATYRDPLERLLVFAIGERSSIDAEKRADCAAALDSLDHRIAILASARSGSEYFGHLLGRFGIDSREYFNPSSRTAAGAAIAVDEDETTYLASLCRRVPNRILCVKGGAHRIMMLIRVGIFPSRVADWKFVHLRRRNFVQQAISALIAKQTDAWTSNQPLRNIPDHEAIGFDDIAAMIDQIFRADDAIFRFCEVLEIEPLTLFYEDFANAPDAALKAFAAHCGIDTEDRTRDRGFLQDKIAPERQRNDMVDTVEQRFREELKRRLREG